MKPNESLITIYNNKLNIENFIKDMIIKPREIAHKWSKITNQTPNLKIGYPFQHLASLITGMQGNATGARGEDLVDGTEIKSCSKIDQSDKCENCGENVLRIEEKCPFCNSVNIKRNNDSKWLIGIRSEDELRMLKEETDRFIFIVFDYPYFKDKNFNITRIRSYEVWTKSKRCNNFVKLMESYYKNIFLKHKKLDPNKTPAPKNIFPDSYPFLMCNPIKTFECIINGKSIKITHFIEPNCSRENIESELMPIGILKYNEIDILKKHIKNFDKMTTPFINENMRKLLPMRDTDKKIKIIGNKVHKKLK